MRTRAPAMVGRDDEIQAVEQALEAARSGRGSAVFLVGEGGIGKSRLAAAAAERAAATGMTTMRGRGSAIGPTVPFRSLTEALLSLPRAGVPIDAAELGPYRPVLGRLIPDWGTAADGPDSGSLVVLAEAVLRLAGLAGRAGGCLMVLDDLQDADAESLAVVEYLMDNLGHQPVPALLLCTVRAEPCAALDLARSAAQRGTGTLVELERLGRDDVRRLAASCLGAGPGEVPEPVADRLWEDSAGNPLLVEELLHGMVAGGLLVRGAEGWRAAGDARTRLPASLTRSVARRIDRAEPRLRELLAVAAILGRRFPLTVVQAVTGLPDRDLLGHLHCEIAAQLVVPDDQAPDWYAFQHPLIAESLLSLLAPDERIRLARRTADAVATVFAGLPGEWCQIAATLRLHADEPAAAGRLFAEAGRRALAQGAAGSAVTLLDRALGLLAEGDAAARADTVEHLLYALAEAGLVERALASVSALDEIGSGLDRDRRAQLHIRLAWSLNVAGRSAEGLAQVGIARTLLGPGATAEQLAPLDVIAAHLMLDLPGPDQLRDAEEMARRAAPVAEAAPLPVVACQAWQLLGAITRRKDLAEATACLERSRSIAVQYHLPIWEIHALVRLGNDDALRDGSLRRLEQARQEALRVGAVNAGYQAEASIALQAVLRGDVATAETLSGQVLAAAGRLKLLETVHYVLLLRIVLAAHRGRRRAMNAALAEFRGWDGDPRQHTPRIHGLARAFCALLEENRAQARKDLDRALAAEDETPNIFYLSGRQGLDLLLRAVSGDLDRAECQAVSAEPTSELRWNRQFALLARAVLTGRSGRPADAASLVAEAMRVAEPYPMSRHLGLRLVGEAALADGWGTPVPWLRRAEEHFHAEGVPAIAGACRALLRRAGAPVAQRRDGVGRIPPELRGAGVTVREYEVLLLLANRLGNREIAGRLHLSPRTVEKHVASLITKTGHRDRIALSTLASTIAAD
ncbi:ATP-binding protein [Paractinoplanes deccanensis]|nr:BREX system ATP-binding domain-containing protein [Actinoplanes deccanensis]